MPSCENPFIPMNNEKTTNLMPYGSYPNFPSQQVPTQMTPAMILATGAPSGPQYGNSPNNNNQSMASTAAQPPQSLQSPYYMAGKLTSYIGCDVRVEFLIGTGGALVDRIGTLLEVGASYIIIRPIRTNDILVCDLFSVKFVTVYF